MSDNEISNNERAGCSIFNVFRRCLSRICHTNSSDVTNVYSVRYYQNKANYDLNMISLSQYGNLDYLNETINENTRAIFDNKNLQCVNVHNDNMSMRSASESTRNDSLLHETIDDSSRRNFNNENAQYPSTCNDDLSIRSVPQCTGIDNPLHETENSHESFTNENAHCSNVHNKSNDNLSMKLILHCTETDPLLMSNETNNKILDDSVDNRNSQCSIVCNENNDSSNKNSISKRVTPDYLLVSNENLRRIFDNVNAQCSTASTSLFTSDNGGEDRRIDLRNADSDVEDCVFSGSWIFEIMSSLAEACMNDWIWSKHLHEQLLVLLNRSRYKNVKTFLVKNNFLQIAKSILVACDQPWLLKIIIGIITNISNDDETIDLIGNDKTLATAILYHLKSHGNIVSVELLILLLLIAQRIQKNPQSIWASYLANCEFLGESIMFMLKNLIHGDILVATRLFQFIAISLIRDNNFLGQLYSVENFFSILLTSFTQVIPQKEEGSNYSWKESIFIESWLMVMVIIRRSIPLTFKNNENFLQLMQIMYRILKPYKQLHVLFQKFLFLSEIKEIEQSIRVIYKSVSLLASLHNGANIPARVDNIVVNMILRVKTNLTDSEGEISESVKKLIVEFLSCLSKYWVYIAELCGSAQIIKILQSCQLTDREYLIHLVQSNSKRSEETGLFEKMEKVKNFFDMDS